MSWQLILVEYFGVHLTRNSCEDGRARNWAEIRVLQWDEIKNKRSTETLSRPSHKLEPSKSNFNWYPITQALPQNTSKPWPKVYL